MVRLGQMERPLWGIFVHRKNVCFCSLFPVHKPLLVCAGTFSLTPWQCGAGRLLGIEDPPLQTDPARRWAVGLGAWGAWDAVLCKPLGDALYQQACWCAPSCLLLQFSGIWCVGLCSRLVDQIFR